MCRVAISPNEARLESYRGVRAVTPTSRTYVFRKVHLISAGPLELEYIAKEWNAGGPGRQLPALTLDGFLVMQWFEDFSYCNDASDEQSSCTKEGRGPGELAEGLQEVGVRQVH